MKSLRQFLQKPWLYLFVIVLGVSLKFYHLNYKLFWFDEICTVGHTSGNQFFYSPFGEIKNITYYRDQVHLRNRDTNLGDQMKGLFSGPNLTPMHYPFLMIWYRVVGDKPVHYRLFSVFIFLITLPFIFLLAKTLFQSSLAGWIACSLYTVSPYIHLYAQEARYYILWAFCTILLHYVLLKAINGNKLKWWIVYTLAGILAMYTSVFSGIILAGHAIYVWILKKETRFSFLIAVALITLCYLPWLVSMYTNREEIVNSLVWHKMDKILPVWAPLVNQLLGYVRIFSFYKEYSLFWDDIGELMGPSLVLEFTVNLLLLAFLVFCFIFMLRKSKREIKWFVLLIILPGFLTFYIFDVARNSLTSVWWRYLIFNTIGIFLIVSYFLFQKLKEGKVLYSLVYLGLIVISLFSVKTIAAPRYWYIGGNWQQKFIENARLFSEAEHPLVITDYSYWLGLGGAIVVFNECSSENIDILQLSADDPDIQSKIPQETYSDIYLVYASDSLVRRLTEIYGQGIQRLADERVSPMWRLDVN